MPRDRTQVEQELHFEWAWSVTKRPGTYVTPTGGPQHLGPAVDPGPSKNTPRLFSILARLLDVAREEQVEGELHDLPETYAPEEDAKKAGGL